MVFRGAGNHAPGLHDGIDATFLVLHGSQWNAVIKERASVPVAIPTILLECCLQVFHVFAIALTAWFLPALVTERRKARESCMEKPAHPNALTFAELTDAIHAVIPVA